MAQSLSFSLHHLLRHPQCRPRSAVAHPCLIHTAGVPPRDTQDSPSVDIPCRLRTAGQLIQHAQLRAQFPNHSRQLRMDNQDRQMNVRQTLSHPTPLVYRGCSPAACSTLTIVVLFNVTRAVPTSSLSWTKRTMKIVRPPLTAAARLSREARLTIDMHPHSHHCMLPIKKLLGLSLLEGKSWTIRNWHICNRRRDDGAFSTCRVTSWKRR